MKICFSQPLITDPSHCCMKPGFTMHNYYIDKPIIFYSNWLVFTVWLIDFVLIWHCHSWNLYKYIIVICGKCTKCVIYFLPLITDPSHCCMKPGFTMHNYYIDKPIIFYSNWLVFTVWLIDFVLIWHCHSWNLYKYIIVICGKCTKCVIYFLPHI